MFSDAMHFLSEMFSHYVASWGGIVLMMIAVVEWVREKKVPKWVFFGSALLFLFVSTFLAWCDEHASSEWRGGEISRLTGQTQGQEAQIKNLQQIIENKDRPVVLRSSELDAILKQQNDTLRRLEASEPSSRKKALELSHAILVFYSMRESARPKEPTPAQHLTPEQWQAAMQSYERDSSAWMSGTLAAFRERFAVAVQEVEDDANSANVSAAGPDYCDGAVLAVGAQAEIEGCGIYLGVLADKLPKK